MIVRFFILVSFVLSLIAAFGAFSVYKSYQTEHEKRVEMESKLSQAQDSASTVRSDAEQQKNRLTDLDTEVKALKKSEQDLKSQLDAKESELVGVKADLSSKTKELEETNSKLEEERKKSRFPAPVVKTPSNTPAPAAVVENAGANFAVPGTTQDATVSSSVADKSVAIEPATTAPAVIPAEAPASDSRVLTVNRKFNFVVVNLGLRDGLRMGDKVEVMQGTTAKALAQIEKIYDKFSAATLLNEDKGNPVHEGDSVRKA